MGRAHELVDDAEGRLRKLSGGAMSSRQWSRELEEIERKVEEATRVQKLENARGSQGAQNKGFEELIAARESAGRGGASRLPQHEKRFPIPSPLPTPNLVSILARRAGP